MTDRPAIPIADMIDATFSTQTSDTETFNCTWTGEICPIEGVMYLECSDNTRFRIAQKVAEWTEGKRSWQIIPSTDSTGEVSQITVVSSENLASDAEAADICQLVGRVVQLGKRNSLVQFKIKRSDQKTLKLTLVNPHNLNLKLSQLLKVQAQRVGKSLQILSAVSVDETEGSSEENQITPISILPTVETSKKLPSTETPPPNDAALTALFEETQQSDWQLAPAIKRREGWEWEAVLPTTGKRARVLIKGKKIKVYEYAPEIQEVVEQEIQVDNQENLTNKLIVRPLGAAKGIGASCFQVFIGPYEIVMDCGTRPKGYDPLPALDHLQNPNLLLITHAHQDHLGAVPVFHARFPGVRMICTPGTREIAHVMLQDCLKVQQMNEDSPELFDETDLERTLFRLETKPIGED
ncbi:MAG: MBL fold metallo-hydrolase, partial [Phormidium sp.]